eukprot:463948_1
MFQEICMKQKHCDRKSGAVLLQRSWIIWNWCTMRLRYCVHHSNTLSSLKDIKMECIANDKKRLLHSKKLGRYGPLLNDEQENEEQEQENANSNNRAAVAPPPRKKRKISDLRFQSHRRAPNQRRAPRLAYLNEWDEYLREKVIDPDKKFVHNPLEYWFQPHVELKYPTLSKIAIHILAIPAASAFVERLFSLSGWLASGKRSHMKPKTLRILCCLKKRKRNYEKEEEKK